MSKVLIYHNPRCSKSREALKLLKDRGVDAGVVNYLETPLSEAELRELVQKLGGGVQQLVRRKEELFGELGLSAVWNDEEALLKALASHPRLMERPVVVCGDQARIGRPTEAILELL